jgi:hypothetical protein
MLSLLPERFGGAWVSGEGIRGHFFQPFASCPCPPHLPHQAVRASVSHVFLMSSVARLEINQTARMQGNKTDLRDLFSWLFALVVYNNSEVEPNQHLYFTLCFYISLCLGFLNCRMGDN